MPIEFNKTPVKQGQGKVELMRVVMGETRQAAADGVHVKVYEAGLEYDVPQGLALAWIAKGRARTPGEVKMDSAAPENKMEGGSLASKRRGGRRK